MTATSGSEVGVNAPARSIGFDSAWADRKKAPGAICSVQFDGARFVDFRAPGLVGFDGALAYVKAIRRRDLPTLVALDQPTIVPNETGMRPVDKVAASLISWMGGGVQPPTVGFRCFDRKRQYGGSYWR